MSGITVSRRDDRLIAVKPTDPQRPERRRVEAELLSRLDHPGIVQIVESAEGEPTDLCTVYAGTDTWERTTPRTDRGIIEGLARVASTVADLHALGTAHRSLVAEHVIVGNDQRPVLCGFADAASIDPTNEAEDLAGLAGLVRHLATGATEDLRCALDDLARDAAAGDLTARALTEHIDALRGTTPKRISPPVGARTAGAIAAVGALLVAGAVFVSSRTSSPGADTAATAVPTIAAPADSAPTSSVPASAVPTSAVPPGSGPTSSASAATSSLPAAKPAIELVHEGRRYGLGAPGDIAVLGDWDCDGEETPALLVRETGTVAVFARWPDADASVAAAATTAAPDATGIEAIERDRCHQLRILEPDGSRLFTPEFS